MKHIFRTAGLAAAAVAGFHTTSSAQTLTVDDAKWWQVSAALRAFYDDNYTVAPKPFSRESFGFELRPGVTLGHKGEQHLVKLTAEHSARFFEDRDDDPWDLGVLADLTGEYRLTENHVLRLNDTFTWSSEPLLVDRGGVVTSPGAVAPGDIALRGQGTNLKNNADLRYIGQLTPLMGFELGYANTWYNYDAEGDGSYSALLDRTEHMFRAETRWTLTPSFAGVLGYWYEDVSFAGNGMLGPGSPFDSTIRDSQSHYFVAGGDYTMSEHTFFSLRGGAQNVTYTEIPGEPDQWNPFVDANATMEYAEGSYFRLGFKYGRNRTDVVGVFSPTAVSQITLDQESATLYGVVAHKLTEALTGRVSGQLQTGTFDGGGYDSTDEGVYILGISLTYDLNKYLALEAGYNYDRIDSDDSDRSYSRNRVFLGVRGQF